MANHLNDFSRFFLLIVSFLQCSHSVFTQSHPELSKNLVHANASVATVFSYHIHCLFINGDELKVKQALELRNKFIKHFKLENVTKCQNLFGDNRLCMFG